MEKGKLKDALETGRGQRNLVVYVYQTDGSVGEIRESNYVAESLKLSQKIMKKGSFALGGCLSSCFSLKVFDLDFDLKNREIQVDFIVTVDEEVEIIHLFHGKITEVEKEKKAGVLTITAYDALGIAADRQWGGVQPRVTLSMSRMSMLISLEAVSGVKVPEAKQQYGDYTLSDNTVIELSRWYELMMNGEEPPPSIEILRQMCELNCTFGFIDGEGVFRELEIYNGFGTFSKSNTLGSKVMHLYADEEDANLKVTAGNAYTIMSDATSGQTSGDNGLVTALLYAEDGNLIEAVSGYTPFTFLAPDRSAYAALTTYYSSSNLSDEWTWVEDKNATSIVPMQNTSCEDYTTDKITGVKYFVEKIVDGQKSYSEVLFGTDENPYIISNNYVFKLHGHNQQRIAEDLYRKIIRIPQFTPVKRMPSIGYPGISNVGDIVSDGDITTIVLERMLTGIQGMDDVYVSEVDKTMLAVDASSSTSSDSSSVDVSEDE